MMTPVPEERVLDSYVEWFSRDKGDVSIHLTPSEREKARDLFRSYQALRRAVVEAGPSIDRIIEAVNWCAERDDVGKKGAALARQDVAALSRLREMV
jgi:hypothetical protein